MVVVDIAEKPFWSSGRTAIFEQAGRREAPVQFALVPGSGSSCLDMVGY